MNLALGCIFIVIGSWLIPSSEREARSMLAPYRALRGVICLTIGIVCLIAWIAK